MPTGFDVRLGPLAFVDPSAAVGEAVGDGLDVVGSALTASDRRPRPLKLKLPVRGADGEAEPRDAGLRLRRQLRQAIDNARLRLQGFFFTWTPDPDLDCWLIIGGAELTETDPGISFGEFELELSDVYIVGRPGTHRPGRRIAVLDRRTGLVPRDTRGRLYSKDFASFSIAAETPVYLPGDTLDFVSSANRVLTATGSTSRGGRHLWNRIPSEDGEVISYRPNAATLPERTRYLDVDDFGSVRVWDLSKANVYPPLTSEYTTTGDAEPNVTYGWERVLGDVLTPDKPLAMDNGEARVVWLGALASQGLAIEHWDSTAKTFIRDGRVLHSLNVSEQRVVECTPERSVLEWRAGRYVMRAILQRGWPGPRLESYDDGGSTSLLEFAPTSGTATLGTETPTWVRSIGTGKYLWASGSEGETQNTTTTVISGTAAHFSRTGTLVAQLAPSSASTLAERSLVDARVVPVLVGR
jgi:hypothetical protein